MKVAVYFALFLCCSAGLYALNHPDWGTSSCAEYGLQKDAHYKGIVLKKWKGGSNDNHHMLRIALGGEHGGFIRDLDFLADTSRFYAFVIIGDSIKKKSGELAVLIKRDNILIKASLRPTCN